MSLLAVLKKSGETLATLDVPIHSNDIPSLHESMKILQQEVNQTLTSLLETESDSNGNDGQGSENEDDLDDDSDADDQAAVNGTKRKGPPDPKNKKKLKTS
ncbi:Hypothetical protein NTJ_15445 [Nesidiocoris tenuis]|uniref:EKC/KEOPS complex subunit GON7 n=1 Tax=Nesidiocoris tenuis TaxID=355587 RepID=A0ABN7BE27_9HEMI|nr:Hypothetical protein NTJ_15445 [Nesidiocoris tenuis]